MVINTTGEGRGDSGGGDFEGSGGHLIGGDSVYVCHGMILSKRSGSCRHSRGYPEFNPAVAVSPGCAAAKRPSPAGKKPAARHI